MKDDLRYNCFFNSFGLLGDVFFRCFQQHHMIRYTVSEVAPAKSPAVIAWANTLSGRGRASASFPP